ncbi:hypothetical protein B2J93_6272 [Marssonina coronariae]|uniref:glutamate-5-semialdehyde dehydrogenase n=1 Tax=Diplocarpon coronariae TaxID=2795749 RepID=A0A218ZD73_9HELO|nr:hypothetical protein B2J93_6272 [Marssonina coronariae]
MSLTNALPEEAAKAAKSASHILATLPTSARNDALTAIHAALFASKDDILAANARDLALAHEAAEDGQLSMSIVSRLDLGKKGKWEDMLKGILDVRGKESTESFIAISQVISSALSSSLVPNTAIQLVTTRDVIPQLLSLDRYIDLAIPRGSNDLVRYIKSHTKIPVLGHADGLCSIYLEHTADVGLAIKVIVDSKTSYPAACNSVETLLVEEASLDTLLPPAAEALVAKGVSLRCDPASRKALTAALPAHSSAILQEAEAADFDTEHLSLVLAIKTVSSVADAIAHINLHGSHHTDVILTSSAPLAEQFMASVDSAGVFWNTSTRMADGMRFGFGTEVGISTNKIHARGPVGLEGLMIYKYKIRGGGHVSLDYGEGEGQKSFKHEKLAF